MDTMDTMDTTEAPMDDLDDLDDLTLLRLHVEAVWGVRAPGVTFGDTMLDPESAMPEWTLYTAELAGGQVRIWRAGIAPEARAVLRERATNPTATGADLRREVALVRRAPAVPLSAAHDPALVVRRIGPGEATLLDTFEPGEADYYLDLRRAPVFGAVVAGQIVSVAHSSRRTADACELGVETLPAARRHGYALAVTLRWADAVSAEGLVPLYSALAENAASLALAATAGYHPFARATYLLAAPATPPASP